MRDESFLGFKRHRYLKLSASLALISVVAYARHAPAIGRYGGTWLGYTLGTIAAVIVLLLLWMGVRKRQYRSAPGSLVGWLSAHVYLGLALVVIATLHAAFEVGWNIHSLAYVLMLVVVVSGIYGVVVFSQLPRKITVNMGSDTLSTLLLQINDLDREARRLALQLPDTINTAVLRSAQRTKVGGSWWRQLRGKQLRCPTQSAVQMLHTAPIGYSAEAAAAHRALYAVMLRKQALVGRARRDVMYKARLQFWLYLHVPLSVALLAALTAHVLSVFFYW